MKKLGKKEDEHIVASDSELDAKIEVSLEKDDFHSELKFNMPLVVYSTFLAQ